MAHELIGAREDYDLAIPASVIVARIRAELAHMVRHYAEIADPLILLRKNPPLLSRAGSMQFFSAQLCFCDFRAARKAMDDLARRPKDTDAAARLNNKLNRLREELPRWVTEGTIRELNTGAMKTLQREEMPTRESCLTKRSKETHFIVGCIASSPRRMKTVLYKRDGRT